VLVRPTRYDEDGYVVPMMYKEKYAEQYRKFKAGEVQTKDGTPLEALTFLTAARVKEFKALNIYTAESMASLEGASLKSLGQGGLEWKQPLANLEEQHIASDTPRRLAGASPSLADGILICPTSAGAVVAVDLATRTLRWGYQYRRTDITMQRMRGGFQQPTRLHLVATRGAERQFTRPEDGARQRRLHQVLLFRGCQHGRRRRRDKDGVSFDDVVDRHESIEQLVVLVASRL